MKWVDVAKAVLENSDEALHSAEIVAKAKTLGLVQPTGQTPDHSLQGAIWKHIHEQGNPYGFVMVGDGRQDRRYSIRKSKRRH
jgi:hypothetical protein